MSDKDKVEKKVEVKEPTEKLVESAPVPEPKPEGTPATKKVYVHEPGTTHLNAYEAEVEAAQKAVRAAKGRLSEARAALEHKIATSTFTEEPVDE